ncbi:YjbF family lipoprotein [Vibrio sp. JPW-9-11-11]|uniref:YjbF family lipoprotein n=1 Tax=Vibrio sp. JPW-9-11-11 TaxID=1416532 RepID=UPI0015937916|nr:YjbF family lipoprotein [Vibrio sp. JPW-9-11-11]NVD05410.1 YjbF family lipoprotein [Vibrio sp. JPW-9-11-11]
MVHCLKVTLLVLLVVFSTGCSQKFKSVNATLNEAFLGGDDIELTKEQVVGIPYASMYVRVNQGPQVFMVLAFAEMNPVTGVEQLKWVSADRAMIVTEQGRIVKTLNVFGHNLIHFSRGNTAMPKVGRPYQWTARYDWEPHNFNQYAEVSFGGRERDMVESLLWSSDTRIIEEIVHFEQGDMQVTNRFWLNEQDRVVKSAQWLIPEQLLIEFEIVKPYLSQQ